MFEGVAISNCLFLDPLTARERFWSLAEALRCPAVGVLIGDASGMDATTSRRMQLASESALRVGRTGPLALLTRPSEERTQPSWATSHWEVTPWEGRDSPPGKENPPLPHINTPRFDSLATPMRWMLELKSGRGQHGWAMRAGQEAPRWILEWTYQVFRGTGLVALSPDVGHRIGAPREQPLAQPA